jgi:hypothetical protein
MTLEEGKSMCAYLPHRESCITIWSRSNGFDITKGPYDMPHEYRVEGIEILQLANGLVARAIGKANEA